MREKAVKAILEEKQQDSDVTSVKRDTDELRKVRHENKLIFLRVTIIILDCLSVDKKLNSLSHVSCNIDS